VKFGISVYMFNKFFGYTRITNINIDLAYVTSNFKTHHKLYGKIRLNLNFIYGLWTSKTQAGIAKGKGFGKVSTSAYVEVAITVFAW